MKTLNARRMSPQNKSPELAHDAAQPRQLLSLSPLPPSQRTIQARSPGDAEDAAMQVEDGTYRERDAIKALPPSFRFQRSHIDGEPVLHIGLHQPVVGFVYLFNRNNFDIGRYVMCSAKLQHLLCLGDPANR